MALPTTFGGPRRALFARLVANGVAQALATAATALLMKGAFDVLIDGGATASWRDVALVGGGLLAALALTGWLRWRGHADAEAFGQSYVHALRLRLFRQVTRIGQDGGRRLSRGALMVRFIGDMTALRNWLALVLARLFVSGLAVLLTIAILAFIEPLIALALATACILTAAISALLGPRIRAAALHARRRRGRLAATLNDRLGQIGVIEAFGREAAAYEELKSLSRGLTRALVHRARVIGLLRAHAEVGGALAGVLALVAGAVMVRWLDGSPGAVVSAMVVAGMLGARLQDLGRVYEYWNGAKVARAKLDQIMNLRPAHRQRYRAGLERLRPGPGRIELRQVAHGEILAAIDMVIEPGERIAVTGPNGAGKSTLLRLIGGLATPSRGEVLLGGENIACRDWSDVRRRFAVAAPDLPLLRGSLRFNLTYGGEDVSAEEIARVLAQCRLTEPIAALPRGLDTRFAERGDGLSQGERARLVLARALLARPSILLLDEAESNLDAEARAAMMEVIETFDGTVVFITHDRRLAARADRIVALDGGRLVTTNAAPRNDALRAVG